MSAAGWPARPRRSASRSIPGFAAAELLYDENGAVIGVATGDMGVERDGSARPELSRRGMALLGKYVLIAEGARGSLAKQLIRQVRSRRGPRARQNTASASRSSGRSSRRTTGRAWCSIRSAGRSTCKTGGGSFLYHFDDNQVAVGFVVHLNYKNPYLSPFEEFQRFKTHPAIRGTFEGGKRARLRRPRHHRGRLAVGAEAGLSRAAR